MRSKGRGRRRGKMERWRRLRWGCVAKSFRRNGCSLRSVERFPARVSSSPLIGADGRSGPCDAKACGSSSNRFGQKNCAIAWLSFKFKTSRAPKKQAATQGGCSTRLPYRYSRKTKAVHQVLCGKPSLIRAWRMSISQCPSRRKKREIEAASGRSWSASMASLASRALAWLPVIA